MPPQSSRHASAISSPQNLLAKLVKPKGEVLHVADNINAALHLVSDDDKNNMYESYNRFRERSQIHVYGRVRNPG